VIILSGVLVVLAIALLVTGIVTGNTGHEVLGLDGLKLIYVSIGVSIISALCLAIGVFLRRKELFGSAESQASARRAAASRSAKAARTARTKARVGAGDDAPVTLAPAATVAEVPAETSVYVVPGRKRYHLETCRQLAGRDKEELTFVEAREEGFTACTACLPDTALAARAALTETETTATAPTESLNTAAGAAGPATADITDTAETIPAEDPALVTRIDLPVTKIDADMTPDLSTRDEAEEDTGTGTREIPAVESPAEGEVTEDGESEAAVADTAQLDEVADAEAAPEPAAEERPLARSRSLFEPLDRGEERAAEKAENAGDDEAAPATGESDTDATPEPESEDDEVADAAEASEVPEAEVEHDEDAEAAPAEEVEADGSEDDAAPVEEESEAEDDAAPDLPYVRILSGTKRYHRPDCALIEDIAEDADDLETLSISEAKERGCTPCLVCQPDKSPSDRL
jgi:hypothetical protein